MPPADDRQRPCTSPDYRAFEATLGRRISQEKRCILFPNPSRQNENHDLQARRLYARSREILPLVSAVWTKSCNASSPLQFVAWHNWAITPAAFAVANDVPVWHPSGRKPKASTGGWQHRTPTP